MEIARLEVSTQQHLERMQETAKTNYVQYGKSMKSKKGKKSTQSGAGANSQRSNRGHGTSSKPSGKGRKLPFMQDTCYRCGRDRHQKVQDCKALDVTCRGCGKKGHFEKVCLKKCSTNSLEVPQASNTSTAGAGAGEPLYFNGEEKPVYTYMVSVPHVNKHLIKFPIALDYLTLFHYFLYGKQFTLETDQKPLVSIYRKHMVEISPRIQRLIVRSFPYKPFDVQYRKGMEIPLADTLSRVTPTPVEVDGIQLPIVAVNLITSNLPVSSTEIELIHEETSKDPTLTLLRHYIHMGWPVDHRMLPQELHMFLELQRRPVNGEWTNYQRGQARLLIPSTLRRKVLEQIHDGHLGIEKCMLKARDSVFWPGISNDIHETVEKCEICQASSRAAKPVGNVSDVPPHAWHTLGTDLFYWNKIDYLVIRNYFSKYLIVRRLPNSSTHAVIKELGLVFTELGRPFILRSDNGPCYSSRKFHNFLSFYQVDHITSSPHYPQSNGFAEALVGITKKLMEKSVKEGKPWNYGLLQYRTTPISSTLPSPLEMLTGRRPHSTLPQLPSSVGKNMETSRIHQELLRMQPNNTSTGAMDLEPGQPVFVKEVNGNIWRTATVDQPAAEPNSYWVRFPDNSILRRTRSMIKPRSQPSHFELQAEAQPGNFEGKICSCSFDSFNQLNGNSMLPVTPMVSVTTPATIDRGSKVSEITNPISSTEPPQPTVRGAISSSLPSISSSLPSTLRCSIRFTKGVPPVRYTPSKK